MFSGDIRSSISSLLTITIVFQHLRELDFKCTYWRSRLSFDALVVQFWVYCHIANRNRFRSKNSETLFNVNLWLFGDFRDPSLKYQELSWQVDTLIFVFRYIMNNVQSLCKAMKGKQNLLNIYQYSSLPVICRPTYSILYFSREGFFTFQILVH